MAGYDIEFFWDPICPFAWITSRWVNKVVAQKEYSVDWRFISLRILNKDKDYATEFPKGYEVGHTAGLRMLRVAAHMRSELGHDTMGPLYTAFGSSIFEIEPRTGDRAASTEHITRVMDAAGLDSQFASAADDSSWDEEIEAETELALSRTGRDVGTPIISFQPPDGPSFFGPVISRVPDDDEAVALWDSVIHLATFPGFAELKRSLRERPQLQVFDVDVTRPAVSEDWKGGSRRAG